MAIVLKGSEFPKGSVIDFSSVTANQIAESVDNLSVRLKSPRVAKSKERLTPEQQAEKDRCYKESLKERMTAAPDDHGAAALYANFLLEKESNFAEALKMAVRGLIAAK